MREPGPQRAAHSLSRRSRVASCAAPSLAFCLSLSLGLGLALSQPANAADTLAGKAPKAGAAELSPSKTYVLLAIFYLKDGKPFGSTDYGLRIPKTFCAVQKDTLLNRWIAEDNPRTGIDTVWMTQRGYAAKLYCLELRDYDNRKFRQSLLKRPLGN